MEITGKLIQINEPVTGESSRGPWKKQEVIIDTEEQVPRKVCLLNWNDKVDITGLKPNDQIKASINIESREFNGRWFTDVKVWKLEPVDKSSAEKPPVDDAPLPGPDDISDDPFADDSGNDDDLPF
ncbi:MAG: DUF3127 domain-containing protein [Candidatus Delongbacteria bacterium]|jgi:hypothetical protein|nr:DUF3127 domain-containing protein [Candidatus Delongbacteria bacterium]